MDLLIASTSTVHGQRYLEYIQEDLKIFFKDIQKLLFIPYARPSGISHDEYTSKVSDFFLKLEIQVSGIHTFEDPVSAVEKAQAIFTGGGNTFELLHQLYKNDLLNAIRRAVLNGTKYFGTSAGSNITGLTIGTTNDMPIVYPPSFNALQLVPFNINPHYLDPDSGSTHMGETRETRIFEFHKFNDQPVIGLREGSWIEVKGTKAILRGNLSARIFRKNMLPEEIPTGTDLTFLL